MKDSELQHLLQKLVAPAANESHTARALDRSLVALRNSPKSDRKSGLGAWIFAIAVAAACMVLAIVFYSQPDDPRVFAEIERLFPGQLLAVIQHGGKTDLSLASLPGPEFSPDQRVRITVRSGGETVNVLTYSGIKICVPLKSGSISLTPLVTGNREVLIITDEDAFERSGRTHSASICASAFARS